MACYLGLDLGGIKIKRFADGEIYVQVQVRCKGRAAGFCQQHVCSQPSAWARLHSSWGAVLRQLRPVSSSEDLAEQWAAQDKVGFYSGCHTWLDSSTTTSDTAPALCVTGPVVPVRLQGPSADPARV